MRRSVIGVTALALLLGVGGCTGDDDDDSPSSSSPGASGSEESGVATETTIRKVSGRLDEGREAGVVDGVNAAVDTFFDGAYLGDFPRTDYAGAFADFTEGAQADAERDVSVLSNQPIADEIDSATATNRRVRLDVFSPDGHPRGVTARFVLDFETTGDVEGSHRVLGELYLAREKGEWKIFGYDVDEAVQL